MGSKSVDGLRPPRARRGVALAVLRDDVPEPPLAEADSLWSSARRAAPSSRRAGLVAERPRERVAEAADRIADHDDAERRCGGVRICPHRRAPRVRVGITAAPNIESSDPRAAAEAAPPRGMESLGRARHLDVVLNRRIAVVRPQSQRRRLG